MKKTTYSILPHNQLQYALVPLIPLSPSQAHPPLLYFLDLLSCFFSALFGGRSFFKMQHSITHTGTNPIILVFWSLKAAFQPNTPWWSTLTILAPHISIVQLKTQTNNENNSQEAAEENLFIYIDEIVQESIKVVKTASKEK